MTVDQIKVIAAVRSALHEEITVILKPECVDVVERFTGTCTWAGTMKFRVDMPQAALFFNYDEVESVE